MCSETQLTVSVVSPPLSQHRLLTSIQMEIVLKSCFEKMFPVKNTASTIRLLLPQETATWKYHVWQPQIIKLQCWLLHGFSNKGSHRVSVMLITYKKTLLPSMILRCCCLISWKPSPLVSSGSSKSHGLVTPRLIPPVIRLDLKIISLNNSQVLNKIHTL